MKIQLLLYNGFDELDAIAPYEVFQDARVVNDGNIITSGGVASGLDLALWLVERYFDANIAIAVERTLEYERRGTVWCKPHL